MAPVKEEVRVMERLVGAWVGSLVVAGQAPVGKARVTAAAVAAESPGGTEMAVVADSAQATVARATEVARAMVEVVGAAMAEVEVVGREEAQKATAKWAQAVPMEVAQDLAAKAAAVVMVGETGEAGEAGEADVAGAADVAVGAACLAQTCMRRRHRAFHRDKCRGMGGPHSLRRESCARSSSTRRLRTAPESSWPD